MHRFRLNRVGFQDLITSDYGEGGDFHWMGEESRWMANVPAVYRALAAPSGTHEFICAPKAGDAHQWPAPAYWGSLLHLLICSFGWRYPREGLRWWTDNGHPTDDLRFALIERVWVADGQFDWFCAWLWSGDQAFGQGMGDEEKHDLPPVRPREWFEGISRAIQADGAPSPYGGGTDPLHLCFHIDTHAQTDESSNVSLVLDAEGGPSGVLIANTFAGWYQYLHQAPALAHDHPSGRSWRIEAIVRPFGSLGVYRRSRDTGRWFAGPHRLHIVGNPSSRPPLDHAATSPAAH